MRKSIETRNAVIAEIESHKKHGKHCSSKEMVHFDEQREYYDPCNCWIGKSADAILSLFPQPDYKDE